MKKPLFILCLLMALVFYGVGSFAMPAPAPTPTKVMAHPIDALLGEELAYDVSFLWFDRLAVGSITLVRGGKPGTYVAVMEARTRGLAAYVTKDRAERFQTLMEVGPDGLLRPLVHSSYSLKGKGAAQREKVTSYTFDYVTRQVKFQKIKDHVILDDELLPMGTDGPVFDILSALYNLRSGALGPLDGAQINLPTFHRKGIEEIVVAPVDRDDLDDNGFFSQSTILRKVLVSPEVFQTEGRDLLVSFDATGRPQRAVIKNVIGLGDVKGVLRQVQPPLQASN